MKMDRDSDFLAKRFHQFERSIRFAQAGHVLDGEKMRAEFFELSGHRNVILQRVFRPAFVENVAGVADGRLANSSGFENRINGNTHVLNGIKRIKDAENVDALRLRFAYKLDNDVVGI